MTIFLLAIDYPRSYSVVGAIFVGNFFLNTHKKKCENVSAINVTCEHIVCVGDFRAHLQKNTINYPQN